MRRVLVATVVAVFLGGLYGDACLAAGGPAAAGRQRPNIVFMLIDDLGWTDVGCFGSKYYETPNIDRLAAQGMRFTDAYAACPVCSPTRASIMTGKYPARLHLTNWIPGEGDSASHALCIPQWQQFLPLEEVTVAKVLKAAGYVSASIGKWHLGGPAYYPEHHGFDVNVAGTHFGHPVSYFWPYEGKSHTVAGLKAGGHEGEYLTDRLTDEAEKFLDKNKDRPFFLYFAHYAVHMPLQAKAAVLEKYKAKTPQGGQKNPVYAAMVESVDDSVGRIQRKLQSLGIADNTVIVFMSDNGGLWPQATSNAPLRAGKGHPYEGGVREPLIINWPGSVRPGTTCGTPVSSIDFFPTLLEMAGVKSPHDVDGRSLVPLLKQEGQLQRDAIYWHYPHYWAGNLTRPFGAVRAGDWKLIESYENMGVELYNLKDDIGEAHDLSKDQPKKVAQLREMLHAWRKSVGAQMPTPNPNYDPTQPPKKQRQLKRQQQRSSAESAARTSSGVSADASRRPNILWLIAEDMGPEALSCSGTPQVWTPAIDRLAAQGVRYTRCYMGPVCSPSRSAFMTGMYTTTIGTHNHRSHRDDGYRLPEGVRVLTDWLRDAGYFTANLVELPPACGFRGTGKTDWNFTYDGKPFDSARWDDLRGHQPFYAQINFHETHRKFTAPKKADPAKVAIPPYYPDHPITRKDWAEYLDSATELDRKVDLVLKQLESDGLADNTVVVFFGDNGQSQVRGKQFCYEEGHHVPLIVRWPKGCPPPSDWKPGSLDGRILEGIDLAPTMLAIAGATKPPKIEGRVFLGDHRESPRQYSFGSRDRCDETVMRIRTVRDARYRYIRNFTPEKPLLAPNDYKERSYPVWNLLKELHAQGKLTPEQEFLCQPAMPREELYDLDADPHEIHNLATSDRPEHQAALARLRGVLEKWIEDTHDQGREFEPAKVAAARGATKEGSDPRTGAKPKGRKKAKQKPQPQPRP